MAYRQEATDRIPAGKPRSALARAQMIARMTGKSVEDVQRKDSWEREAHTYSDNAENHKYPPVHSHKLRDHAEQVRNDSDRKPGESGSALARRKYLERLNANSTPRPEIRGW